MATSRTISSLKASRSRCRPFSPAIPQKGFPQQAVERISDAPALLRGVRSLYSSNFCGTKGPNLHVFFSSSVPSLLSMRSLSSFRSIRDVDSRQAQQSNHASVSQSSHSSYNNPPERIPNRPFGGERRNSFDPSAQQQNYQRTQTRFGENESHTRRQNAQYNPPRFAENDSHTQVKSVQHNRLRFGEDKNAPREMAGLDDSAFLEKFKLGFDQNKGENPKTKRSSNYGQRGGDNDQAAAESSPLSPQPPEDADEIFKKMKETGLIPNAVAMLHGLTKDALIDEAMKLFRIIYEKRAIPEVVIYTAVVECFCKAHKLDDAIRIFKKMQSNGIVPNAFSYGILIEGLYLVKRLDDATEFCVEMLEAGHSPNVATFTGLVDGYCREKGLEEAQTMINTLRQKGFKLNDRALREFLEKRGPFLPLVWEAIFGKKSSESASFFR